MRMNKLAALFIIAIIVSPNLTIVRGQTLTLAPLDGDYAPGDDVSISGTTTGEANLTLIVVFNSTSLYEANFTAEGDGNYTEEYEIPDNATEGVYTVTVSDGGESVDADFTVASDDSIVSDDSRELAETIIEQAENLKDNVEDAFDDLEDVEVPSVANSSYLQGIEYLNMAKEAFDAGNYTEASDMAFNAIQSLGYALEEALKLQPEVELAATVENDESDNEDAQGLSGLSVALERANRYWDKLNATVTRLEDNDYNVSSIRDLLDDAKIVLDESLGHVAEGNFTATLEDFTRARKVLGRINSLLNSSTKARKEKQAEKFLKQFQKRVEKINGTVMGLQGNLAASKSRRVKAILESTAETLLNMSGSLSSGNLTDVLDDLDDVVEELDEGLDELNGEGLSKQIKSVYRFMAKIDSLNRSLQRLANAGYHTSGLDEYLSEAKSLLIQSEEKIREGDEGEAEGLLEEAERFIEEAQELLKKLQKNSLRATRVTENGRGRSGNPGLDNTDNDEGVNITASSEAGSESDDIAGELRELLGIISRIEERLDNLSLAGENTTDVEHLIENAEAIIEKAKTLVEENPDEAEKLINQAKELVEETMDIIEKMMETESNVSVAAFEPDDDDDEENLTHSDLPDEEPDDVEING
jgi:hypothetical protein